MSTDALRPMGATSDRATARLGPSLHVKGEISGSEDLLIEGSVEGLNLKEFFLLLSPIGLAYRRCELEWVNGDQIGVAFLRQRGKQKRTKPG